MAIRNSIAKQPEGLGDKVKRMSKKAERREEIKKCYDLLDPKSFGMLPFPTEPFEGSGELSDRHLAEVVYCGSRNKQQAILFAIQLGRELQREGM